ncbi:hypothetical protein EHI8A_083050 [Entamoeba histolytica HM-1:IMSS-B]|uniref:GPI transamidase component PIG-U n=6 Tax=Entamoeba histolytica TaxID=5759 RepID=C4LW13_ENTH1|nr:hypothetical protein, conserved [Entamoeba histolytica HM-1:IMSS]EMD48147.1 GPI transamidase component PIGU, putative [Entamoeba histolytica KU27]EMH74084.1 hypothetical protein EHI8A_083050 [Entamoeba histolytica HM-1:IMSS-B]EMS15650.1 GPI transamidase component PIG-U, putative [Entamoeba histolytica HM-3:IMSS]ENY63864.1 GPI transamidase component PIG-U, putative [Entamoeba histolytica HM-1:IMSS-A]GAT92874.1 hypothetical protein conserved [Entamoeba histolytica]|eukprot:XP_652455.1 hypothetical protein, conserved [Entamoeba histolytica HM-1:IMSS]
MEIPFIVHFIIGLSLRLILLNFLPTYLLPSRVELNTSPFALLDQPNETLLTEVFSYIPQEYLSYVVIILSVLPSLPLVTISKTSACVLLYNPFGILASLSISSYSLITLLESLILLIPKHKHLFSPFLPITIFLYPATLPLLLPLLPSLSPTVLLTCPIFYYFRFCKELFVSDLTPNLGLYWNLFTNMFPEYNLMYTVILPLIPLIISFFIFTRMITHQFYYFFCVMLLIAVCNPYLSVQDLLLPMALYNIPWSHLCVYFWKAKVLTFIVPILIIMFSMFNDALKYSFFNSNMAYSMNLALGFSLFSFSEEIINGCLHNDFLVKHKVLEDRHIDKIF